MDRRERDRVIGVVSRWAFGLCGGVVWVADSAYECTVVRGNLLFNGVSAGSSSSNVVLLDKEDLPCSGVGVPKRDEESGLDAGRDCRGRANGLSGMGV
jgi:hypothetical protein